MIAVPLILITFGAMLFAAGVTVAGCEMPAVYWHRRATEAEARLANAIERDPKTGRLKRKIS